MASATAVKMAAIFMVALTIGQLMVEALPQPAGRRLLEVDGEEEEGLDDGLLLMEEAAFLTCPRHCRRSKTPACRCCRKGSGCHLVVGMCKCPHSFVVVPLDD
uniref:Uncharacterized protein n=1 Tax=Leersia perrieri TaxID=77586 RepID=A0A0D9XDH0_9ORYZ